MCKMQFSLFGVSKKLLTLHNNTLKFSGPTELTQYFVRSAYFCKGLGQAQDCVYAKVKEKQKHSLPKFM